eukprot:371831-Prymnesium_polylepis.1
MAALRSRSRPRNARNVCAQAPPTLRSLAPALQHTYWLSEARRPGVQPAHLLGLASMGGSCGHFAPCLVGALLPASLRPPAAAC